VADWTDKWSDDPSLPRGQGHKNWCGIEYGEEDLDWKVAPVEGKGLGVVALRQFPAKTRIMVDACQLSPTSHPATKDLMPENGSLESKLKLNALAADEEYGGEEVLCLRMSRVNHTCNRNAGHIYEPQFKVKVRRLVQKTTFGKSL
jgi:hypothetical protein